MGFSSFFFRASKGGILFRIVVPTSVGVLYSFYVYFFIKGDFKVRVLCNMSVAGCQY